VRLGFAINSRNISTRLCTCYYFRWRDCSGSLRSAGFQSSGGNAIPQKRGEDRSNTIPTGAFPSVTSRKLLTVHLISSVLFMLTRRSFCPSTTLEARRIDPPVAVTELVRAISFRRWPGFSLPPHTRTGIATRTRWILRLSDGLFGICDDFGVRELICTPGIAARRTVRLSPQGAEYGYFRGEVLQPH
jgi:hypothetical protein